MQKIKNKNILLLALFALLLCAASLAGALSVQTAQAATPPKYTMTLNGTYTKATWGGSSTGTIKDQTKVTIVPGLTPTSYDVEVYLSANSTSGNGVLANNGYINFSTFNITCSYSPCTMTLYNSSGAAISSSGSQIGASLADGQYRLNLRISQNSGAGYTKSNIEVGADSYFNIDTRAPTITGASTSTTGKITNKSFMVSASDSGSGIANFYMKSPSYSGYRSVSSTVSVTQDTGTGLYSFYAVDRVGNTSSTYYAYFDSIAPVGTITSSDGTRLASGAFTNKAFSYSATDTGIGVSYLEYRMPNSSTWNTYSSGTRVSGTRGTYAFRARDKAGNISEETSVYYDATNPTGTVYAGSTSKTSGAFVNADSVKYVASDVGSGIASCYVKQNNESYSAYANGSPLYAEGKYTFYSLDAAGNRSSDVTITLDRTKPTGTLYAGENAVQSGKHTNAAYIKFVPFDAVGVAGVYVLKPDNTSFVPYSSGTQLTAEGTYSFYVTDLAGNTSDTYSITVNRQIPGGKLYADGNPMGNNSYTNGKYIRFESAETCYVRFPNEDRFVSYVSGTEFYMSGKYTFYAEDVAGNFSGYYSIVIDRAEKPLEFVNVTDGITNGDVEIVWTDGNPDTHAPVQSVTVNGLPYVKGAVLHTIDTGIYSVKCVDAAGNGWESSFVSHKRNIPTQTLQKQYYEAADNDGNMYSFSSFENALSYSMRQERAFVRTGEWNNNVWDTGMAMDAKDSVNAVNGIYYIYKRSGKANEDIAYFTQERLNEVIGEYARKRIQSYFYWEKEYATIAENENLFTYSDDKTILASGIELGENVIWYADGEIFNGLRYETEGEHIITATDAWGNACEYTVTVIRNAPEIRYTVNENHENGNTVLFDRNYLFKDMLTIGVCDAYDPFAMFCVYDGNGTLLGKFHIDETYAVTESGNYTVQSVNHCGYSRQFAFTVSLRAPEISVYANAETKRLEVSVKESADDFAPIDSLEIYKSIDGGLTWTLISTDDYGTVVLIDARLFAFRTSGLYRIVVADAFRTGIDAAIAQAEYVQPIPEAELRGVENGGHTNRAVAFYWQDEACATVKKDGETVLYRSGGAFEEDGYYEITFTNYDGYEKLYTFTIDTICPKIVISGAEQNGTVRSDVSVFWAEDGLNALLHKDGVFIGKYLSNTVITEDGIYTVIVSDAAGNKSEATFVIDKTVDYLINVNNKGLANTVSVVMNEELEVTLVKDGATIEYDATKPITASGYYVLTLTDKTGNIEQTEFTVVPSLTQSFEYNFDDMPGFELVLVNGEFKRLNYGTLELKEEGVYDVGIVVSGQTYLLCVIVDQTAPTAILSGVENNSKTKGIVTVSQLSESASIEVYKNGTQIPYELGQEITEYGEYKVVLYDMVGNEREYNFTIQKKTSGGVIALIVIAGIAAIGGGVFTFLFVRKRKKH